MMSDNEIAEMYVRIVQSDEYVPVTELGYALWNRLRADYGEREVVRMVAQHARARLGIGE